MWEERTVHDPLYSVDLGWAPAGRERQWDEGGKERLAPSPSCPVPGADSTVLSEIKACSKQPNKALESTQQGLLPKTKLAAASRGVRRVHSKGEPRPFCCHCVLGSHSLASPCLLSQAPSLDPALKSGQALLSSTPPSLPPKEGVSTPKPTWRTPSPAEFLQQVPQCSISPPILHGLPQG